MLTNAVERPAGGRLLMASFAVVELNRYAVGGAAFQAVSDSIER